MWRACVHDGCFNCRSKISWRSKWTPFFSASADTLILSPAYYKYMRKWHIACCSHQSRVQVVSLQEETYILELRTRTAVACP